MREPRDGTIFESFVSDSFRCITHKESTLIYSFFFDRHIYIYIREYMTDEKKCQADWPFQHHLQTVLSHFTNSVFQSCQLVFITSPKKGRNNQLRESSFFLGVTADPSAGCYWQRGLEWSERSQSIDLRLKTCCGHLIQSDMMPVACWSGGGGGQSPGRQSGWWDSMAGETTICRGEMCVSTHSPPFGKPRMGGGVGGSSRELERRVNEPRRCSHDEATRWPRKMC